MDHGTRAIRFASTRGGCYELRRSEAKALKPSRILELVEENLGFSSEDVDLVAMTYSMGDGICQIVRIEDAVNRGLLQQDGAGLHVGGGTRVYEALEGSGWPVVLLPGIHRGSDIDPRLKVFSHGMSPEKVGLAYHLLKSGVESSVISDASSNTVTLGVLKGRIVGAIDAPIFAPGLLHGPLDVEAIRAVDSGRCTANTAFTYGGILRKQGYGSPEETPREALVEALDALALFAAMEMSSMLVLMRDLGDNEPGLYLAGSPALQIVSRVSELLGQKVRPLGNFAAAGGCAQIAEDIYGGARAILGIEVDERIYRGSGAGHG